MAVTTVGIKNSSHSYDSPGYYGNRLKEDFDGLYHQGETGTPLLDIVGGGRQATNNLHSWDVESTPALKRNRAVEGMDLQFNSDDLTAPDYNVVQTSVRDWTLSVQAEKMNYPGRASEMQRKMDNALLALRRDMEAVLLRNLVRKAAVWSGGVDSAEAGELGGIGYFVKAYADAKSTGNVAYSGSDGTFDYDDVKGVLKAIAAFSGVYNKRLIAMGNADMLDIFQGFAGTAGDSSIVRMQLDQTATLHQAINTISTRFGIIDLVPNALCPANVVYIIDPAALKLSFLGSGIEHIVVEQPSGGQARKLAYQGAFYVDYTLEAIDPLACGIVYAKTAIPTGEGDLWTGISDIISF